MIATFPRLGSSPEGVLSAYADEHPFTGAAGAGSYTASVGQDSAQNAEQILQLVFDPMMVALRVSSPGTASGNHGASQDWRQVLKRCYDPDTNSLRVVEV